MNIAALWHGMPLQTLHFDAASMIAAEYHEYMQHVAAATQLTELYLT